MKAGAAALNASGGIPHVWSFVEAIVTGGFTLLFFLFAFFFFKPAHVEHHPNRVYVGAALQGFIIGALVAFAVLPLRWAFFVDPSLIPDAPIPPKGIASLSVIPMLLLLLVVRRGFLARAPLIGRYIRAYRRAALKYEIDISGTRLARLEALDARSKSTEL